jgi:sugar transferase (PEP-CTERM/EpsH1 system associated)
MLHRDTRPLVAHVIYRFGVGGLENGLVNLINHMPEARYRHAVICLTEAGAFASRVRRPDVQIVPLGKRPGKDPATYLRLRRALRSLRPDIVHTRNLAALDNQWIAWSAGVPHRVHGEHGWDIYDLHGANVRYRLLRRATARIVDAFVAVSRDIADWLTQCVGVPAARVRHISNGVDLQRFTPREGPRLAPWPAGFAGPADFVIGSVGRFEPVKDPLTLVRAFIELVRTAPEVAGRVRLAYAGDGALRAQALALLEQAGVLERAWLPGIRADVPDILRACDLFVLPSLNEGISNTVLEAMATGVPVVASAVGGNPELIVAGENGALVPPADPARLARELEHYVRQPDLGPRHGRRGREMVEARFSLTGMIERYLSLYDSLLQARRHPARR